MSDDDEGSSATSSDHEKHVLRGGRNQRVKHPNKHKPPKKAIAPKTKHYDEDGDPSYSNVDNGQWLLDSPLYPQFREYARHAHPGVSDDKLVKAAATRFRDCVVSARKRNREKQRPPRPDGTPLGGTPPAGPLPEGAIDFTREQLLHHYVVTLRGRAAYNDRIVLRLLRTEDPEQRCHLLSLERLIPRYRYMSVNTTLTAMMYNASVQMSTELIRQLANGPMYERVHAPGAAAALSMDPMRWCDHARDEFRDIDTHRGKSRCTCCQEMRSFRHFTMTNGKPKHECKNCYDAIRKHRRTHVVYEALAQVVRNCRATCVRQRAAHEALPRREGATGCLPCRYNLSLHELTCPRHPDGPRGLRELHCGCVLGELEIYCPATRRWQFALTVPKIVAAFEAAGGRCQVSLHPLTLLPGQPNSISIDRLFDHTGYPDGNWRIVCVVLNTAAMTKLTRAMFVQDHAHLMEPEVLAMLPAHVTPLPPAPQEPIAVDVLPQDNWDEVGIFHFTQLVYPVAPSAVAAPAEAWEDIGIQEFATLLNPGEVVAATADVWAGEGIQEFACLVDPAAVLAAKTWDEVGICEFSQLFVPAMSA